MNTPLQQFTADHRYLLATVAREVGFADPVAVDLQVFHDALLEEARKGKVLPLDGVLVRNRGVIFFDDMDLALRDREKVHETEDQAVFLTALDGIEVHEGVVFVFTSNCAPELIDRAFKRPGRTEVSRTQAGRPAGPGRRSLSQTARRAATQEAKRP
jgi:hypothetical protein